MERSPGFTNDLWQSLQFSCGTIRIKSGIQAIRDFIQLKFHRHPMQHPEIFHPQLVHLRMQQRAQFIRINRLDGQRAHAGRLPYRRHPRKNPKFANPRRRHAPE
ncbi:MAG: hypothetical protein CFE26_03755 [Verrucomicrobiales bacterium VVV1]|nr:MAG: hypothetical protein CFE26_03755 [Verrucomicrobiales bacterium VVV1]